MRIGKREIGPGHPTYIIYETASTHGGEFAAAVACVEEAARCGADAVKFQLFEADKLLAPITAPLQATYDYFKRSETPRTWYPQLKTLADECGIDILCTPFDPDAASYLHDVGIPAIKIASGDLTNPQLLARAASLGNPVILSTGMATMEEIQKAVVLMQRAGAADVALLQSVSVYPTCFEDANVAAMNTLAENFRTIVGYSDNGSAGVLVPLLAVARGASIIEKHVTLRKDRGHIDDTFSMSTEEFSALVNRIRGIETRDTETVMSELNREFGTDFDRALGDGVKRPAPHGTRKTYPGVEGEFVQREADERHWARRGVYVRHPVKKGETIREDMLALLRPDVGISAMDYEKVIGQTAAEDLVPLQPLSFDHGAVAQFRRADISSYVEKGEREFARLLEQTALFG